MTLRHCKNVLTDGILIFACNASKVALAEKSEKFNIRDIGVMAELMDSHCGKNGGGGSLELERSLRTSKWRRPSWRRASSSWR